MSKHRYQWIDEMLREWVAKCDDIDFLKRWRETITVRVREMERRVELPLQEIVEALDKATPGDPLFPQKRVRIPWDGDAKALRDVVYVAGWNSAERLLVVAIQPGPAAPGTYRKLEASEISFYQLATQRLHVRRQERLRHLKIDKQET